MNYETNIKILEAIVHADVNGTTKLLEEIKTNLEKKYMPHAVFCKTHFAQYVDEYSKVYYRQFEEINKNPELSRK